MSLKLGCQWPSPRLGDYYSLPTLRKLTIDSPEESAIGKEVIELIDVSGTCAIAVPRTLMRQFSEPTEKPREDNELEMHTMLTEKMLNHIAQILWGFRLPCHPSYSPEVVLESFVFLHHHKMWALAGRTYAWLRWYFLEHQNCPNDLCLTRAWQITCPGHPLRDLLLSSLWHKFAEIPDFFETKTGRARFRIMYAHRGAGWFVDLRPGSWFANFHALLGKATGHEQVLDRFLRLSVDAKANRIKPGDLATYIGGLEDDLSKILTGKVTLSPGILSAPDGVKSDYQAHMAALCADTFQSESYLHKVLIEPELQAADPLEGTVWQLREGTKTGLVTSKDETEPSTEVDGGVAAVQDPDKARVTSTSAGESATEDGDQANVASNSDESDREERVAQVADQAKVTDNSDEYEGRKRAADNEYSSDGLVADNQGSPTKKARRDAGPAGINEASVDAEDSGAEDVNAVSHRENDEEPTQGVGTDATEPDAASAATPVVAAAQSAPSVSQKDSTRAADMQKTQQAGSALPDSNLAPAKGFIRATNPAQDASRPVVSPKPAPKPKKVQRKSQAERQKYQLQQEARDEQRANDLADQKEAAARKTHADVSRYRYDMPSSGPSNAGPRTGPNTKTASVSAANEAPLDWVSIQVAGAANSRPGLLKFTLRPRLSNSAKTRTYYLHYATLQANSKLYADKPLDIVAQPVDLSASHIVSPEVFECVYTMLLGESEKGPEAITSTEEKVGFCVAAVALGCKDLVETCLGPKEDWENGYPLPDRVAVTAYSSVMGLKDEQGRSPMPVEQREKLGAKILWEWVATRMAVKAKKANMAATQVPEMFEDIEMEDLVRAKLIVDIRRELNCLKAKSLDRLGAVSVF